MCEVEFIKNYANKTITVERMYKTSQDRVWSAWTDGAILDQWWGPKPWSAVTKSINFSEGGHWHYYMAGPDGEKHWCLVDYLTINPKESFTARDSFCDEDGTINQELPSSNWKVSFSEIDGVTSVVCVLVFDTEEDMRKIIEMGFEQGFEMGLNQLEEHLEKGV